MERNFYAKIEKLKTSSSWGRTPFPCIRRFVKANDSFLKRPFDIFREICMKWLKYFDDHEIHFLFWYWKTVKNAWKYSASEIWWHPFWPEILWKWIIHFQRISGQNLYTLSAWWRPLNAYKTPTKRLLGAWKCLLSAWTGHHI